MSVGESCTQAYIYKQIINFNRHLDIYTTAAVPIAMQWVLYSLQAVLMHTSTSATWIPSGHESLLDFYVATVFIKRRAIYFL